MKRILLKIYFILITLTAFHAYLVPARVEERVVFLNVGQGDSALLQYGGVNILVDTGPDDNLVYRIGRYLKPQNGLIDILVLTHPHYDHISATLDMMRRYQIGQVWFYPVCYESAAYEAIKEVKELNLTQLKGGELAQVGDLSIRVIYPDRQVKKELAEDCYEARFNDNVNNDSVILEISAGGRKILMMGDAEFELERYLLSKGYFEDVDILKVGHHCSDTSTSAQFLRVVQPEIAICSFGTGNSYGHPSRKLLELLGSMDVKVLRTDGPDVVIGLD